MRNIKSINLKALFNKRYKIGLDPAAKGKGSGKNDPWYFLVLCKYGDIYPYSDKLLAFYCISSGIRNRLHRDHPEIDLAVDCDTEGIFLFKPGQFDLVAKYAKPKRRRKLSPEQKAKQIERLSTYSFKAKKGAVEISRELVRERK